MCGFWRPDRIVAVKFKEQSNDDGHGPSFIGKLCHTFLFLCKQNKIPSDILQIFFVRKYCYVQVKIYARNI